MRVSDLKAELRPLFRLALPLSAAQAGTQLMSVVDMAVLGRLGGRELAGAGLGNAVFFGISVFGMGMMFGMDPLIAQAVGAGDRARARHVLWQGIWLALVVSAFLTVPLAAGPLLFRLIGVTPELIDVGRTYLLIRTTGLAPWLLFFAVRSYLQAHHVTRPLIVAMVVGNVFNLLADILLVFGGGFLPAWTGPLRAIPALGVAGAAIVTVVGQILQLWILCAAVRDIDAGRRVSRRWNTEEIRRAFRVGLPAGLQVTAEVGIFALVALLAGRLGTVELAAHQIVITLASFTFTVALGVATAGSVRVGLAVGARDQNGTRLAGFAAIIGSIFVMAIAALIFVTMPGLLARMLTDQQDVIAAAIPLFFVAAAFQLSDGIQAAGVGVLRGAADTKFAFIANIIGYWIVGLPVALFLGFRLHMGVVGLWWGFVAGLTAVAAMVVVRFEKLSAREITPVVEMA